ncbi:hypothetical protein JXB11_01705 [Candidatus Woesearchaeota archaeon]|nr:hypothetical protein [Candidatus Woesearchaeota archaeon]
MAKTISEIEVKPGVSYKFDEFTQSPTVIPFKYRDLVREEAVKLAKEISKEGLQGCGKEESSGAVKVLKKFFEIKEEEL